MKSQIRSIRFGTCDYNYPSAELEPLRDSNDVVEDRSALLERLNEDGYLYLPGYLNREEVLSAREEILAYMAEHEGLEPGSLPLDGVMGEHGNPVPLAGKKPITHRDSVLRVLASPRLYELHERIQGESVISFDYKWLRAVGNEAFTGSHMDHVYMGRGSERLMTVWIPLGDLPLEQGSLCVCPGSHRAPGFEKLRNTYGRMDVDHDGIEGWFTRNPREVTKAFGGSWRGCDVKAGDIITFGMHLMHASTVNTTNKWRFSCDVRFQPATDPVDPRWAGENPSGHTNTRKSIPMTEARVEWGV